LNLMVEPTCGSIWVPGELLNRPSAGTVDITKLQQRELQHWRRKVGMIFQQFNLVKRLSVSDNVLSGALGYLTGLTSTLRLFSEEERLRALRNLDRVGLLQQAHQRADTLSGGQQQRVAIARALMQRPAIILADEPVASLDPKLSLSILDLLKQICLEDGITILISLHILELAKRYAGRVIGFADGAVAWDGEPTKLGEAAIRAIYQARTAELKAYPLASLPANSAESCSEGVNCDD
ncbi:MAG: ATP-binding cassette domain-containing protein, partial [Cyanobacteria bacterium NC_groundwater_1444_Ag_S-0.65um_54_12]|nr:ATP-binding cassette domain-containing protein [Cyanobacteria bacterium NC_groundwater_1444_Ag_S-0.65um_54_12]